MAEINKTESVDNLQLINSLKDENNLPKLSLTVKEQKKRLDLVLRSFEDINRKREQQAIAAQALAKQQEEAKEEAKTTEKKAFEQKEKEEAMIQSAQKTAEKVQPVAENISDKEEQKEVKKEEPVQVQTKAANQEPKAAPKEVEKVSAAPQKDKQSNQTQSRVKQFEHNDRSSNQQQRTARPQNDRTQGDRKPQGQPYKQGPNAQQPGGFNRQGGNNQKPYGNKQPYGNKPAFSKDGAKSGAPIIPPPIIPVSAPAPAKKTHDRKDKINEEKKMMSKRTLVRRGFIDEGYDDDESAPRHRKLKVKKAAPKKEITPIKIEKAVITTENLTVKMLSEKIGITAQEILKKLMILGIMTTINGVVDFDTMELVASEFGVKLEKKLDKTKEEVLTELAMEEDAPENLKERPPIVTVMGHVDHGKTSLLDAIRKTNVTEGEAGGITQHIGAYTVNVGDKKITFIDTPGHEAFTAMRSRGAKITDIVIIVVAADDGVMPQTIEAINHAKAADVPIIIAINKMDKPGANPQRILEQLSAHDVLCEAWGGDSPAVEISAKTRMNIDKLLSTILTVAEIYEYKANPNRKGYGAIIEAKIDKNKGPIANIIVQNGTLKVGDTVVSGITYGHVRALQDDKGRSVKEAGPSMPVSILGFSEVPNAGDPIYVVEDEKLAKQVISERIAKQRASGLAVSNVVTLNDVFNKISEGQMKDLNLIIKADVQGSVEALKESLSKLSNEEVKVNIIHSAVGAINKSDVMLAEASKAIIIGFNVRPDSESKQYAENVGIDIRLYRIIYDAIDDVNAAIKGMLDPKYKETVNGQCEVRNVFKITGAGIVAGCYVTSGKILRSSNIRVLRNNTVIFDGSVGSLKRLKDDVKEVASGFECGVTVSGFSDFKVGDVLESYTLEKI